MRPESMLNTFAQISRKRKPMDSENPIQAGNFKMKKFTSSGNQLASMMTTVRILKAMIKHVWAVTIKATGKMNLGLGVDFVLQIT